MMGKAHIGGELEEMKGRLQTSVVAKEKKKVEHCRKVAKGKHKKVLLV